MSEKDLTPEQRAAALVAIDPNDRSAVMLRGEVLVRPFAGAPEARWIVGAMREEIAAAISEAVEAERAACAAVADEHASRADDDFGRLGINADNCARRCEDVAAAIRARGGSGT